MIQLPICPCGCSLQHLLLVIVHQGLYLSQQGQQLPQLSHKALLICSNTSKHMCIVTITVVVVSSTKSVLNDSTSSSNKAVRSQMLRSKNTALWADVDHPTPVQLLARATHTATSASIQFAVAECR
jgi:hypothetical protein